MMTINAEPLKVLQT